MKVVTKLFMSVFALLILESVLFAEPEPIQVQQSSLGLDFKVYRTDDMPDGWYKTYDNFFVTQRADDSWVYGRPTKKGLVATKNLVGAVDPNKISNLKVSDDDEEAETEEEEPKKNNKTAAKKRTVRKNLPDAEKSPDEYIEADLIYEIISKFYDNAKTVINGYKTEFGKPSEEKTKNKSKMVFSKEPYDTTVKWQLADYTELTLNAVNKSNFKWVFANINITESSSNAKFLYDRRIQEFTDMLGHAAVKRAVVSEWDILNNTCKFFVRLEGNNVRYFVRPIVYTRMMKRN